MNIRTYRNVAASTFALLDRYIPNVVIVETKNPIH